MEAQPGDFQTGMGAHVATEHLPLKEAIEKLQQDLAQVSGTAETTLGLVKQIVANGGNG